MNGIPGSLFLPLALAISFSMVTSYLLAQTLVPILSNWLMKEHNKLTPDGRVKKWLSKGKSPDAQIFAQSGITAESEKNTWQQRELHSLQKKPTRFDKFRTSYMRVVDFLMLYKKPAVLFYVFSTLILAAVFFNMIGQDVLPKSNSGQFQLRIRDKDGTRIEKTERDVLKVLSVLNEVVGKENLSITSSMIGMHGSQFSTNPIYLFMAGPQEAVLQVALKEDYEVDMDDLKDELRSKIKKVLPQVKLSFEPIELTDKILSQGSPTSIEVKIVGKNKKLNEVFANKIIARLNQISYLRDVQLSQAIHSPAINIEVDRIRAAQLGANMSDISRSLVAATSSSRFTEKNIWLDSKIGQTYSVQVQVPENEMTSIEDVGEIPLSPNASRPVLADVATISVDSIYGENDNVGATPVLSVTANLYKMDLGTAAKDVNAAIQSLGDLPRGLTIETKGLSEVLHDTLDSLQNGLLVAIIVIFLMLAANFQSFKVSLVVLCTVPAVLSGSLALLLLTGCTLNLQSYMGMIMSVGVSISNSVLLVTNAEELRLKNANSSLSAKESASVRLRPILMTSVAMIVGMIPMASGIGEGAEQAAPLGIAVIGGLLASTFAALLMLPLVFAWVQKKTSVESVSLDPEDNESKHYIPDLYERNDDEKVGGN